MNEIESFELRFQRFDNGEWVVSHDASMNAFDGKTPQEAFDKFFTRWNEPQS